MDIVPDMADARKFQDWSTLVKAVRAFRAVSPDTSLLDDEAFVFFFDQVPDAHFRLECMVIRNSFGSITASLSEKVKVLLRGVQLLRSSEKLKVLFNSILKWWGDVGIQTVLNEGTPLGDRPAFKLQTLAKLFSLKGTAAGTSATLATFLAEQGGAIFDADELTSLGHAQKTSLVHVYTSVISLIETHSLITDKETPYPSVDGLPDNFFRAMVSFGEESAGPVDDLLKRTSELLSAYVMLCQYIGDVESFLPVDKKDGKNVVPDVFAMMVPFLLDYHSLLKSIRPKDSQQSRKRFPETSKADPEKRVKSTSAVNHQPTVSPASPEPRTISFASEPPPTMFAPSFARELKPAKNLAFGRKATNPFGRSPANPAPARRRMSIMNVLNMASEVAPVSFSVTRAKIGGTVLFPKGLSDVKDPIEEEESDESEESENCNVIDLSLFQK
ncbi:MAG: LOW QUALITY PROTEIN: uncharacterized protein KVP18_000101 [Porospora cf. gigantea A]|uniref:uncharacterized protein n=1 Tax=Porospora cf. gigantea A TaxID=2853593 RepID=UPI00355A1D9B|nr:MAG: LOW QUALITY PROTEIN: hypothetical protein KVP18_000101 [Porospora cf. gigantea A]